MAENKDFSSDNLVDHLKALDPLAKQDLPEADEAVLWRATAENRNKKTRIGLSWNLRKPTVRWAAPFAATAALALAVGATVGTLSKPTTPLFSLASGGSANSAQKLSAGMNEGAALAGGDAKIGLWFGQTFDYSAANDLDSDWKDRGLAYRLVAPSSPERILKQLAEIFKVEGSIAREESGDSNQFVTYTIGKTDGTEKAIWLYWSAAPSWNFYDPSMNPAPKCLRESAEGCVEYDSTAPDASLLPRAAEIKAFAASTMKALGLSENEYRLYENRDSYGAYVRTELLAGSTPVAIETYFGWNTLGLTSAGGTIGTLEEVSEVPLIAPSKTVSRISDWRWSGGLPGSYWQSHSQAAVSSSTSKDISVEPLLTKEDPAASNEPMPTPDPISVTIDKFESQMMVVWSAQGGTWVVPGYVLTSKDAAVAGQLFAVLAVADGVIQMPELEQGAVTY